MGSIGAKALKTCERMIKIMSPMRIKLIVISLVLFALGGYTLYTAFDKQFDNKVGELPNGEVGIMLDIPK